MVLTLSTSCRKSKPVNPSVPSATYSRTLSFPNQNNLVKAQAYTSGDRLESSVGFSDGRLGLMFFAPVKTDGSKGESIYLQLDVSTASNALVRTHQLNQTAGGINNVRFAYSERNNSGDIWGSITEKAIGTLFSGTVTITRYDARQRTISGNYNIEAKSLINDPTLRSIASQIDPANLCDLRVSGTFEHIKVQ